VAIILEGGIVTSARENILLVGRKSEIAKLDSAVSALASGPGHVTLLTGEPGIGKSELARYVANAATCNNIPVHWGFAWEVGGAPAYWPWTQLLRSLTEDQTLPLKITKNLGELLPEFANEKANDLGPDQARFQLMESVRALLRYTCQGGPVVLILEDLHAADGDSLRLLHYLARHSATLPILIVGTYRNVEARALPDFEVLWRVARDAELIKLKQLNETDVRTFLRHSAEQELDDEQVHRLLATTSGNPLFLTELVQMMGTGLDIDESGLPANVQQVIRQQIGLLPGEAPEFLAKASIQGRVFDPELVAAYSGRSTVEIADIYSAAIDARIIKPFGKGLFRFSHALHRDVVYQDLGVHDRTVLHLVYADLIRNDIEGGNEDRWSELAKHLDAAGGEYRQDAITAWKKAASRAQERLAFDEAAKLYSHALDAFGAGPKYEPRERFALLLSCANTKILAGDITGGQQQCRDAFVMARTLEDAELMSTAALTWGSVFIIAKVDKDMIAALKECLERISQDDVPTRARLMARLAAALQPAPEPAIPMAMAREAIELARSTNDDEVLFQVLRSAISALMDFATVSERLPLNQEFGKLAAQLGDIPGRFRSNLRIIIDASEAGNRALMVTAINDCDELARRIGLPHYLWRAASMRAMQALIEGQFELATRLIEKAQIHSDEVDDSEADIILPLQRLLILTEWELAPGGSLETIMKDLHGAFDRGTPEAEFFIAPFVQVHAIGRDKKVAQSIVSDSLWRERVFEYRDRFSLCFTGEIALLAEDFKLAERVFEASITYVDDCVSLGLLGKVWTGPVATYLGNISLALGRVEEASDFYHRALEISKAMKAQPCVARLHLSLAETENKLGRTDAGSKHLLTGQRMCEQMNLRKEQVAQFDHTRTPATSTPVLTISQQGDVWNIQFKDAGVTVRSSKGIQMLFRLVESPGQEFHVLDLSGSKAGIASNEPGPALDAIARNQYKQRIGDLKEQLEEAHEMADIGRSEQLQAELDILTAELSRAYGLGGRQRRTGSDAERARVNVRRRIKDAIDRISEQDSDTGRYLKNTIKTGSYCKYSPM